MGSSRGEKVTVTCATSAFGSGVDIGHIRTVIHADVPYLDSDFAQESGRCLRNGKAGPSSLFLPTEASSIVATAREISKHPSNEGSGMVVLRFAKKIVMS